MRLLKLFVCLTAFAAPASGVILTLSGNSDPTCTQGDVCIYAGTPFDVMVNSTGGGYFVLLNQTGMNITELDFNLPYFDANCSFTAAGPTLPTLSIDPSFTANFAYNDLSINASARCNANSPGAANYFLTLDFLPGVPDNFVFNLSLNNDQSTDPNGTGGWVPGDTSNTGGNFVPEPGTIAGALGGLGMLCLAGRRRFFRRG